MSKSHSKDHAKVKKTSVKLANQNKKLYAIIFGMLFAVAGALALLFTQAASIGTLSLSPSTTSLNLDQTVTVYVMEDSRTEAINAVQADIAYDATKLQLVSVDGNIARGTSAFDLEARKTSSSGRINLAYGSTRPNGSNPQPMTGPQRVATIVFKAVGSGSTTISFLNTSLLLSSASNQNVLSSTVSTTLSITDKEAPKTPTGLTSPSQTINSVNLAWTAATDNVGVSSYNIYRNGVKVGSSPTPAYSDSGLAAGTTYRYAVQAQDAAGNTSLKSTELSVATKADTVAPTAPTGLILTGNTGTSIAFKWNAATDNVGVTGYRITLDGKTNTTNTTSYNWTGLSMGKSYTFVVVAYDARGNTSPAASVRLSTTVDSTPPTTPTGLTARSVTSKKARLSWNAASDNIGVTGYNIYRNGSTTPLKATGTSYEDTGLTAGTIYSYTIRAVDAGGNLSPASSTIQVKVDYRSGDVNDDGGVNMLDFGTIANNWGKTGATRGMGDLNKNGTVDLFDLSIMAANWDR